MTFDKFCLDMWLENCVERDSVGEPLLRKVEYITSNKEFLREEYEKHV